MSLYSFQEAGVLFMLKAGSGLLGDEMGSGLANPSRLFG